MPEQLHQTRAAGDAEADLGGYDVDTKHDETFDGLNDGFIDREIAGKANDEHEGHISGVQRGRVRLHCEHCRSVYRLSRARTGSFGH